MRSSLIIIFTFLVITILSDIVIYKRYLQPCHKNWLKIIYLTISSLFFIGIIALLIILPKSQNEIFIEIFIWFNWILLTIYIPKFLFTIFLLLKDVVKHITGKNFRFIANLGAALGGLVFVGFLYGALIGRFDLEIKHVTIKNQSLPPRFDGLKIVQLSDIHAGSLSRNSSYWKKAIELANAEHPDIIVMTGDMMNNFATELTPSFVALLKSLKAKEGKFAILGNHDYGDYTQWTSTQLKQANFSLLLEKERQMGFRLLLDEHILLTKEHDTMVIAGVQNWSKPPFHCYGNLAKAMKGTEHFPYVLLLSHDPNHWMAQAIHYPNIQLMLAGHTHGMQFGIDQCGIHWSPAQWMFKQWDGLYTHNNKALYVSRGIGYLGIPMRLGMPPELTVITLHRN